MKMEVAKKNLSQPDSHCETDSRWKDLAEEAKAKLADAKLRVIKLRAAARFFEQKAASGAPWEPS